MGRLKGVGSEISLKGKTLQLQCSMFPNIVIYYSHLLYLLFMSFLIILSVLFTFLKNHLKKLFLVVIYYVLLYSPCHWFVSLLFFFCFFVLYSGILLSVYQIDCLFVQSLFLNWQVSVFWYQFRTRHHSVNTILLFSYKF